MTERRQVGKNERWKENNDLIDCLRRRSRKEGETARKHEGKETKRRREQRETGERGEEERPLDEKRKEEIKEEK